MKNQKGSSPLIVLLMGIILVIICGIGWYVLRAQSDTDESNQAVTDASLSSIEDNKSSDNLKKYELQYEKISVQYPNDFSLNDTSFAPEGDQPGTDDVVLRGADNVEFRITTGLFGKGGFCETCKVLKSEAISTLGSQYHLNYVDRDGSGYVSIITVAENPDYIVGSVPGKNIIDQGTARPIEVSIYVNKGGPDAVTYSPMPLQTFEALPDVMRAVEIIKSLTW